MNIYSWHTTTEKDSGGWYKCTAIVVFPGNTVKFNTYPFYKQNLKGGHRHNHIKNARKRMRKCKECGDPIVKGMEARIELPLVRGCDDTMCRCCLRMLDEEIYHHNYGTVKEIEMMEADL